MSKCPSISRNNMGDFTEVEKEHSTSRSGPVKRSHLFGLVNCMIFGTMLEYPTHVYEPLLRSGRNPLFKLDTPVFTDCEKTNLTLREEPPKTVTFYDNLGRSCSIDDPRRNWSDAWEATEFTITVNLGLPGIPQGQGGVMEVDCC